MSFPRLTRQFNWLLLPVGFGLPLLTGACGAPLAVTAASYGADGVSYAASKKTTTDHFASMVTKEDCALWRIFKKEKVCKPRETDHDPYQVDYDEPFRMQAEGAGVSYGPPLNAPAGSPPVAWEASAYDKPGEHNGTPTTAVAQVPGTSPTSQDQSISKAPLAAPAGTAQAEAVPALTQATPAKAQPVSAVAAPPSSAKAKKKVASNKTKPKKASPGQVASVR